MDNKSYILLMTGSYMLLSLMVILAYIALFRRNVKESERGDIDSLVGLLVPSIAFCLWLLWICMYMAQMNPMIYPIKHIHEHVPQAQQASAATA